MRFNKTPRSAAAWGRFGQVLAGHGFTDEASVCFAEAERLDPHEVRSPDHQVHFLLLTNLAAAIPEWRRLAAERGGDRYPVSLALARLSLTWGESTKRKPKSAAFWTRNPTIRTRSSFRSAARKSPKASFKRALIHWAAPKVSVHAAKAPSRRRRPFGNDSATRRPPPRNFSWPTNCPMIRPCRTPF